MNIKGQTFFLKLFPKLEIQIVEWLFKERPKIR